MAKQAIIGTCISCMQENQDFTKKPLVTQTGKTEICPYGLCNDHK